MPKNAKKTRKQKPASGQDLGGQSHKKVSLSVRQVSGQPGGKTKRPKTTEEKRAVVAEILKYEEKKSDRANISSVDLAASFHVGGTAKKAGPAPALKMGKFKKLGGIFHRPDSGQDSAAGAGQDYPLTAADPGQGYPNDARSYEREDRAKQLMLWSGVIFFMLLITFGWYYNLKQSFGRANKDGGADLTITDWNALTGDIGEKMEQMSAEISNIRSFAGQDDNASGTAPSLSQKNGPSASSTANGLTDEKIDDLMKKLEELEYKDATASQAVINGE